MPHKNQKAETSDSNPRIQDPATNAPVNTSPTFKIGYGDYLRFRDLVLERSGLHFPEKKRSDLETGLLKALVESPLADTDEKYKLDKYYELLLDRNSPTGRAEMDRLIKALTVNETYFFRNEAQFKALAAYVLPELIARKRAAAAAFGPTVQPQLRIWSAGCASGEEPYSIAVLLKELLPDIDDWHIFILGTDINHDSLARARKALYSEWSFREPWAKTLRPRYFKEQPTGAAGSDKNTRSSAIRYRLRDDIRQMVTLASLNLVEDDYPAIHNNTTGMDLILCRNVTIYFIQETTQQVVQRFYKALVEGGWLVVGHSEPSLVGYRAFQTHNFPDTILYQKIGRPTAWPDDEDGLLIADERPGPNIKKLPQTVTNQFEEIRHPLASSDDGSSSSTFPPASLSAAPTYLIDTAPPVELDPYELAKMLLNKGDVEEAIAQLHRKLIDEPNFAPAHSLLGRAYANLAHWTEARHWCESALQLDNLQAEAYHILALVHQHEQQIESAIILLKRAIYLEREAPLPHFNLAMLYKKTGQMKEARRTWRNTIKILERWPPESIIPDSGGATARHLLQSTRRILKELTDEG